MSVECERLGGINLSQGVCDMEVPAAVIEAANRAMRDGVNAYTRHDGLKVLRDAVAHKMATFNRVTADPETEVVISGGSTGALYCACLALLDPGDEVILFEPYYGYHLNTLLAVGAVPRFVTMHAPDWTFDLEDVERAVTTKTRAIIVNTPGNPTGKVYSQEEIEGIGEIALRHDLFLFTDEIYEYFVYGDHRHLSPAALPDLADRTITVSGYSKTFSITGWRIGYAVADRRWAEMIGYVNDLVYVCAPAPLQVGVAVGITELGPEYYAGLRQSHEQKLQVLAGGLRAAEMGFVEPAGAYYILADATSVPGATGKDKAMNLLRQAGVATVPGEAFYHDGGGNLLRFCYAKEEHEIAEAARRLASWANG